MACNPVKFGQIITPCYGLIPSDPPPIHETIHGLVPHGLSPIGPVHIPQTIYGLKII